MFAAIFKCINACIRNQNINILLSQISKKGAADTVLLLFAALFVKIEERAAKSK